MSDETTIYKVEEQTKLAIRSQFPAVALIAIGGVLLVANIFHIQLINWLWPGFVLAPGLLLLWPAHHSTESYQSRLSFLAVPGAVITMVGFILFVLNLTDHWESWAYAWTLVFAAGAAGLSYAKRFDPSSSIHQFSRKMIRVMGYLFIGFALFFEGIIFQSFTPWLPLLLIGGGLYLLIQDRKQAKIA